MLLSALITGLVVVFVLRLLHGQQRNALKEQLYKEQAALQQLQQEVMLQQQQKETLIARATTAEGANAVLQQEMLVYRQLQEEYGLLQKQWAVLTTRFDAANEKLLHQQQNMEAIGEKFRFEFRNLAQQILEEKTAKFTTVNEEKMTAIVNPLKTAIGDFKKKVEETYDKESKERFTLEREIQRLVEMSQLVSQEANNLTSALKSNNKQQGNWGEMILESILSYSGLTNGREYFTQEFIRDGAGNLIKDENGKALQPDVTVVYPDQRKIIIDSKVSLLAWEQYVAEDNVGAQKLLLKEHVISIRRHIDGLHKKNYPLYAGALNYVLLFIPIEPAFLEALKNDLPLWKYAYDKRIMLVSATNLLAILKIIGDLWRVEQQNQHALTIATKAGALYDKFVGFIENLEGVGKKLLEAQQMYDQAFRQLSTGKGNMIGRVEELKKMGASAQKQLPVRVLPPDENTGSEYTGQVSGDDVNGLAGPPKQR